MTRSKSLEEPLRGYFSRLVVRYTITHLAVEKSYRERNALPIERRKILSREAYKC
jgi:hypothetical protein